MRHLTKLTPFLLLFTGACSDVENPDDHDDHNHGLVTRVELTFTPTDGGSPLLFTWADESGDGNGSGDLIDLPDGGDAAEHVAKDYTLDIELWNDLHDPVEDITLEIEETADEHQVFLTGTAVEGPATLANDQALFTHSYGDFDTNGLPVGLSHDVTTAGLGSGELTVTLRHLTPENRQLVKVEGIEDTVATDGFDAIGGSNDVQVTFDMTVQ